MQLKDCYFLGTIVKKHGLKGHVVLKLDTDEPSFYHTMESILITINEVPVPFFIQEITVLKSESIRLLIEGLDAESLIGKKVYQPLSELPTLLGNKFYYHEIIGFDLVVENQKVGTIKEVLDNSAQPMIVVAQENTEERYIPIVEEWITEVNRAEKKLLMDLPEGILEM